MFVKINFVCFPISMLIARITDATFQTWPSPYMANIIIAKHELFLSVSVRNAYLLITDFYRNADLSKIAVFIPKYFNKTFAVVVRVKSDQFACMDLVLIKLSTRVLNWNNKILGYCECLHNAIYIVWQLMQPLECFEGVLQLIQCRGSFWNISVYKVYCNFSKTWGSSVNSSYFLGGGIWDSGGIYPLTTPESRIPLPEKPTKNFKMHRIYPPDMWFPPELGV